MARTQSAQRAGDRARSGAVHVRRTVRRPRIRFRRRHRTADPQAQRRPRREHDHGDARQRRFVADRDYIYSSPAVAIVLRAGHGRDEIRAFPRPVRCTSSSMPKPTGRCLSITPLRRSRKVLNRLVRMTGVLKPRSPARRSGVVEGVCEIGSATRFLPAASCATPPVAAGACLVREFARSISAAFCRRADHRPCPTFRSGMVLGCKGMRRCSVTGRRGARRLVRAVSLTRELGPVVAAALLFASLRAPGYPVIGLMKDHRAQLKAMK